jgi:FdhE protein
VPRSSVSPEIDQRIARARRLAQEQPPAAAMLEFYADLCEFQAEMHAPAKAPPSPDAAFADAVDIDLALKQLPAFAAWLQLHAPPPLAQTAERLRTLVDVELRQLFSLVLADDPSLDDAIDGFVAEVLLQPFARAAAQTRPPGNWPVPESGRRRARCPVCGGRPTVGALREEGHGARRTLTCGLCLTEWDYHRVICASCPEERFDALPVYTAEGLPHVRIEACDSCRCYIKTIDLSKDGHAVPVVDDLATPALDLWTRERGYERIRRNVLRL